MQPELKEEMNKREFPDSFTLTSGSAAKGTAVQLKVYFNFDELDNANEKMTRMAKTWKEFMQKGLIQ